MRIVVGGDHAGFPLKGPLVSWLRTQGHDVTDHGTHSPAPVDFPDIAKLITDDIRQGNAERAIMVCGTGVGAAIAGNKTPGIRAAVCHDAYSAHQCVEHDNVNLLCIGAQIVGDKLAQEIIVSFLNAQFSTEEHFRRRVAKLDELERRSAEEILQSNSQG